MNEIVHKKKNLDEYSINDEIDDIFVIAEKQGIRPYAKGYSFTLKCQDSGGYVIVKFWGSSNEKELKEIYDKIKVDGVVRLKSRMDEYNGNKQVSINNSENIIEIEKSYYDSSEFIRKSEKDGEKIISEIKEIISSVENKEIKKILESFYTDRSFISKFASCPGAMKKHHGWIGGLLEHTFSVLKISLAAHEQHTNLDRDLLIAGALLHDIGKMEELNVSTRIDYSTNGNLIGHIVLGVQILTKRLDELNISEETKQKVLHMVISHHGEQEFGSPVTPCFPEAIIVHKADELDAKTVQMLEEIKERRDVSEEEFQWSRDFGRIMTR